MTDTHPDLAAETILAALERHGVLYVVVGGFAAQLHGAQRPTFDIDVTPAMTVENLDRLAAAFHDLGARIPTDAVEDGLPFRTDGHALLGSKMLNLVTPHGELDPTFSPAGTEGYDDSIGTAELREVGAVHVHLAALAAVIRSKTAAGREKDFRALPELHRLAATRARTTESDPDRPA
jgi:hypothetical protein